MYFKPITIVNIALFVLNFFNLQQGDILTKAEKLFETLKVTSLPLPIWYQDRLTNQWKSRKLILQGKGSASISPDGSNELTWLPLWKIRPKGAPNIQTRDETTNTSGGRNSSTSRGDFKRFPKNATLDVIDLMMSLLGDRLKTLTIQDENLISQQGMHWNPKNIYLLCLLCLLLLSPLRLT